MPLQEPHGLPTQLSQGVRWYGTLQTSSHWVKLYILVVNKESQKWCPMGNEFSMAPASLGWSSVDSQSHSQGCLPFWASWLWQLTGSSWWSPLVLPPTLANRKLQEIRGLVTRPLPKGSCRFLEPVNRPKPKSASVKQTFINCPKSLAWYYLLVLRWDKTKMHLRTVPNAASWVITASSPGLNKDALSGDFALSCLKQVLIWVCLED